MQVSAFFAHHNNQEAAKFLVHIARELAKQLQQLEMQVEMQAE
jgi:hypothetical protein